jgi:hypothetical protein
MVVSFPVLSVTAFIQGVESEWEIQIGPELRQELFIFKVGINTEDL